MEQIEKMVRGFVAELVRVIREEVVGGVDAMFESTTPTAPVAAVAPPPFARKLPRKKGPIQLCPVPGCKERAAPSLGMVCAKHKGVPKAKIKKYREARRIKNGK